MSSASNSVWVEVERMFVAASLGETTAREAKERMCGALEKELGRCALVDGHCSSGDDDVLEIRLGNVADETAATLILSRSAGLEPPMLERLRRLFERVLELAHPVPRGAKTLHQLRNRLAGVQANIEFVEMVLTEEESSAPGEREEMVKALAFALQACREMATTLRGLGTSR